MWAVRHEGLHDFYLGGNHEDAPQVRPRLVFPAILLLVAAGALVFRLARLGDRPMHADEAVQAARFRDLWQHGRYVYDPREFHGPTLSYATLPSVWIAGPTTYAETTAAMYRVVPVLFGAGLVLLLWALADGLGRAAALCAAALTAVSPALVFYSRYYIHETLLVFFTLAAIVAFWRYWQSGKLAWCLGAGACVGLMQATKETCVIAYLAMAIALLLAPAWRRLLHERPCRDRPSTPAWHWGLALAAAVLVAAVLLSSFLANPKGPVDGVLTYSFWLDRASGASPHVHPWYYYLRILAWRRPEQGPFWSEGLILTLAAVGFVVALAPKNRPKDNFRVSSHQTQGRREAPAGQRRSRSSTDPKKALLPDVSVSFVRWLAFYTLALTALYSAIPYKTLWCLLGFLHGMILLAGVGAVALVRAVPTLPLKGLLAAVLVAACGHLAWQSYRASYVSPADPTNPYVYVHTLPDVTRLARDVEQLAKASPERHRMRIQVIWDDRYYWPLPWYLRRFERVKYWQRMPDDPPAPVLISTPRFDQALTERLEATHQMTDYYAVRPNVFALLWVQEDLWKAHLKRLGRL